MCAALVHVPPVWVKEPPEIGAFQAEAGISGQAADQNALYFDMELHLYGREGLLTRFSPDTYIRELEQRWIHI